MKNELQTPVLETNKSPLLSKTLWTNLVMALGALFFPPLKEFILNNTRKPLEINSKGSSDKPLFVAYDILRFLINSSHKKPKQLFLMLCHSDSSFLSLLYVFQCIFKGFVNGMLSM